MPPRLISPRLLLKVDGKECGAIHYCHTYLMQPHATGCTIKAGSQASIVSCREGKSVYPGDAAKAQGRQA